MNTKGIVKGAGVVSIVMMMGLMMLALHAAANGPSGFIFIDENGNGVFDAGEWNSTAYEGVIQDAVDNASSGDTIYVWNGTYMENNITIDKPLTIIGNTTVNALEGPGDESTYLYYLEEGFWINADWVNISGFDMHCTGWDLAGIYVNNSNHCNISGNVIEMDNHGICLKNSSFNTIYNNYIANNFIGIWMVNGSGHNTIEMNNVSGNDYGIVYEPRPYYYTTPCWNTIVYNNISYNGIWGIMMSNTSNETIMHNQFYYNGDFGWGGAVALIDVTDSSVAYNTMYYNSMGIYLYNCSNVTAEHNDILYGMDDGYGGKTYHIYVEEGGSWHLIDEVHLSRHYRMMKIEIPPSSGDIYRVRIAQSGGEAAHIDYVALEDGAVIPPSAAAYVEGGDVLQKVMHEDNDVADAWGKTIEFTWHGTFESPQLIMVANEEQPTGTRIPMLTPRIMYPSFMESYVVQNNGAMVVDGVPDDIGDADFSDYWVPGSGHPEGYTYLWLRCDGEYLYATMEVTPDNTYDDTGWGALYVVVDGMVKEFRVDAADDTYGTDGFVYTDKVAYQHMVYEFRIPLSEIGAAVGDTIRVGYGSYGTLSPMTSGVFVSGGEFMRKCNNTIQYNTIEGYYSGIYLMNTDNETVAYNDLFNNTEGIWLLACRDIDVFYNTILFRYYDFGDTGIWDSIMFCHNNLSYNTISGYNFGIYAEYTDNETILGNNISYCFYAGIWLDYVWDSAVGYNTLYSNGVLWGPGPPSGILMTDCYNVDVFNNDINGSYMLENAGISISSMGDGGPCYNTLANNTVYGCYAGMYLEDADNETMENNMVFDNYYGIWLYEAVNNTMDGNTITNNSRGIYLKDSPYNDIINNYIAGNIGMDGDSGIHIEEDSNHTTITGNTITRNDVGIYIYGGPDDGFYHNGDTKIHWNDIYDNYEYGVVYDIAIEGTPWINATWNWWGAVNGPYDPSPPGYDGDYNYGDGDSVTDYVRYDPWLGLMLYEGWNLVSPGFIGDVENASDLAEFINEFTESCTIVSMWDAVQQKYVSYVVGFGFDFSLVNGSGYFVYVIEDVNLYEFEGILEPEINITLLPGYNLLGWPFVGYISASELADNITHTLKVGTYDAELQIWLPEYFVTMPIFDFDVLMGEGVFVYVTEVAIWTVEMAV